MTERNWVSRAFWAAERPLKSAQEALQHVARSGGRGLNVGAGGAAPAQGLVNLDLTPGATTDCVADALKLPFAEGTFASVLSQETVEHVANPFVALSEMRRVLAPGGAVYLQVPFVIGYHPDPEDHWRFTRSGVERLFEEAGLETEHIGHSFAAATGTHRILVEFTAGAAARIVPALYRPIKGATAILFYPIKWLDRWMSDGEQSDRIAGGYFGVGRKPD